MRISVCLAVFLAAAAVTTTVTAEDIRDTLVVTASRIPVPLSASGSSVSVIDREQIEARLRELLGVTQIIWLGDGIVGDDTDGHIDDLTRFVAEDLVVTVVEQDPADENHAPLMENRERLAGVQLPDGRPLRVLELPMPAALYRGNHRLPASYANFYVGNRVVLLPTFNCPADEEAAAILARCFPGRKIVSLDCRDVVVGLGTFHCLTQQVPVAPE